MSLIATSTGGDGLKTHNWKTIPVHALWDIVVRKKIRDDNLFCLLCVKFCFGLNYDFW